MHDVKKFDGVQTLKVGLKQCSRIHIGLHCWKEKLAYYQNIILFQLPFTQIITIKLCRLTLKKNQHNNKSCIGSWCMCRMISWYVHFCSTKYVYNFCRDDHKMGIPNTASINISVEEEEQETEDQSWQRTSLGQLMLLLLLLLLLIVNFFILICVHLICSICNKEWMNNF